MRTIILEKVRFERKETRAAIKDATFKTYKRFLFGKDADSAGL
ncbi:MAG: hypothetical protein ACOH2A_07285 [Sphingobacteriaceae bacterium]